MTTDIPDASAGQAHRIAVVGAGLMGAQIGLEFALAGYPTTLVNRSSATSARALQGAKEAAELLVHERLVDEASSSAGLARLFASTELESACRGASYVVESITEDLFAKVEIFRRVARVADPTAVLATNTSSLSVSEIGRESGAADRLIGTHYWNPPTLMPLVEVVPGEATSVSVVGSVVAMLSRLGKEPVTAPDIPGFVWNRIQFAVLREAVALVTRHGVSPATVDRVLEHGLARRWLTVGPFATVALGGTDTFATVAGQLFPSLATDIPPSGLRSVRLPDPDVLPELRRLRNEKLAELLRTDRRSRLPQSDGGSGDEAASPS